MIYPLYIVGRHLDYLPFLPGLHLRIMSLNPELVEENGLKSILASKVYHLPANNFLALGK